MAIDNQLVEALNDCIDRLNAGETLNEVLNTYPDLAPQLHPMLEAGFVIRKIRHPSVDVMSAQENVSPKIQETINTLYKDGGSTTWGGLLITLLIMMGLISAIFIFVRESEAILTDHTPTAIERTIQATTIPTLETITIIEGPVTNIRGNSITIYDQEILLVPDDPRLSVMQLDDILRVETAPDNQMLVALDIKFVNVLVVINASGQIWRGDDCNIPPPQWVDNPNAWFIQCRMDNPNTQSPNIHGNTNFDENDDDD